MLWGQIFIFYCSAVQNKSNNSEFLGEYAGVPNQSWSQKD